MGICNSDMPQSKPLSKSEINRDLSRMMTALKNKQDELASLKRQCAEEKLKKEAMDREQLLVQQKLQRCKQKLQEVDDLDSISLFISQELNEHDEPNILHVYDENTVLQEEIAHFKAWKHRSLLRAIKKQLVQLYKMKLSDSWILWKEELDANFSSTLNLDLDISAIEEDGHKLDTSLPKHIFEREIEHTLQVNPILKAYNDSKSPKDKPMSYSSLFKLIGEMLDKKAEADSVDLEQGKPYQAIPQFTLNYIARAYGLKSMSDKLLCGVVTALKELYHSGHPYGSLLCRILQLFHSSPILTDLSLYLVKARIEFIKLTAQGEKTLKAVNKPRGSGSERVHKKKDSAFLVDTMLLVSSLFEDDKLCRSIALRQLKPLNLTPEDYLVFRICHRTVTMALTPDKLYSLLNPSKQPMTEDQLVEGIRKTLEIYFPNSDTHLIKKIFNLRSLNREAFVGKINLENYYANCKSPEYTVSIVEFWNCLTEAYRSMQTKDIAQLKNWYISHASESPDFEEFSTLVLTLDPSIEEETMQTMFKECICGVDADSFCTVGIKYAVGGYGIRNFRPECICARDYRVRRRTTESSDSQNNSRNSTPVKRRQSSRLFHSQIQRSDEGSIFGI